MIIKQVYVYFRRSKASETNKTGTEKEKETVADDVDYRGYLKVTDTDLTLSSLTPSSSVNAAPSTGSRCHPPPSQPPEPRDQRVPPAPPVETIPTLPQYF